MKFDTSTLDGDAPPVALDADFRLPASDVQMRELAVYSSFESAPDDDADWRGDGGKAKRYASNFEEGKRAEDRFREAAEAQGWTRIATSSFDDKVRRIDAAFAIGEHGIVLLDIKGAKRLSRSHPAPQYRFHWLELHDTGSLFSGESSVLALEVGPGRFALFNKQELRVWISNRIKGPPVARSTQALFRPYQRDGKLREWITLVDVKEMSDLCKGVV